MFRIRVTIHRLSSNSRSWTGGVRRIAGQFVVDFCSVGR